MLIGKRRRDDEILSALFFRLLPVQVGLVAMESINAIIDGVVAARFIDPAAVGVIGLYYTVLRILEAIGGLLLSGTAVTQFCCSPWNCHTSGCRCESGR